MKKASVTIYFLEHSKPGKVEGMIYRRVKSGTRFKIDPRFKPEHFDYLDDIPDKLRNLFKK